ncbi:hypothetical protein PENTCL1PPCAC_3656, partial [Pristionchus entomophagus]
LLLLFSLSCSQSIVFRSHEKSIDERTERREGRFVFSIMTRYLSAVLNSRRKSRYPRRQMESEESRLSHRSPPPP